MDLASYRRLALSALLLTLVVIVMGAWVRLTDAGLGCPDWPGCYGQIVVPADEQAVAAANAAFPERPLEQGKAWREMIHRYAAGLLGLLVLAMAAIAWWRRDADDQPVALTFLLLGVVVLQALLGMWTVTLLVKPAVVTLHLLGGMTTLGLLCWLFLRTRGDREDRAPRPLRRAAQLALVVVAVQIYLGGWTSTNYAALACPDLPTCQGQLWPDGMDHADGFRFWRGLGVDYEGGVLPFAAQLAVHHTHRVGAVVTALVLILVGMLVIRRGSPPQRAAAGLMLVALGAQFALGLTIVALALPLSLAVAHNGGAALLLMASVNLIHHTRGTLA